VYFDLNILDENYSAQEYFILLAVVKKTAVDNLLKEFAEVKADITEITLNSLALINLFSLFQQEKTNIGILDIGFSSSLLTLIKKDTPYLSREIKIGADSILERLATNSNTSKDEMEQLIIKSDQSITITSEDVFAELFEEIRNSFDYFEMNVGEQVQKVYITGGFSRIKEVQQAMNSFLGVEVILWNPLQTKQVAINLENLIPKEMLTVVLGLSL
jgi:Tfp pilus assembly PilM family ATPase